MGLCRDAYCRRDTKEVQANHLGKHEIRVFLSPGEIWTLENRRIWNAVFAMMPPFQPLAIQMYIT